MSGWTAEQAEALEQGEQIPQGSNAVVKLPRLDSNQQPFGLSKVLCS